MRSVVQMESQFITTGHGSGGRLTQQLTSSVLKHFDLKGFEPEDCAWISDDMAIAMDGFTVDPLSFPGGDIGKLAVCGSVNDLAVRGVKPDMLTMSLIIEEGLPTEELHQYMQSAADVCKTLGTRLIGGDTKVVPKGTADKLFITTCAVGTRMTEAKLGAANLRADDALILSASPGRHGAMLAGLRFGLDAPGLKSDCAPLWPALKPILGMSGLRAMRDCTRGGLGTVLCEWAESSGLGMEIEEKLLPMNETASSVCDILGFDLLWLASEGCALIAINASEADECIDRLRMSDYCKDACIIGRVKNSHPKMSWMLTKIGGERIIDMPNGEILPRIC